MHLANTARDDFRVMRDARTLAEAGFSVTVIDIEEDHSLPREEEFDGIRVKHTFVPGWFTPARFKPWFLIKLIIMFMYCVMRLLKDDADIYHAHVEKALPASFVAARLRRKPLIFDAPDLTLSDPSLVRWQRLRKLSIRFLGLMISRCTAFVTASPHYAPVLRSLYHASRITVIRNVPSYRTVNRNDLLRQHLGLSSDIHIA
ncbi:MAG: glycosyltransferase family 4 protein, partial [Chloroflexi bacterium]